MGKCADVIAIYSRKSRFTGKGESVGNQVELCRGYIRAAYGQEYADAAAVFEDEGFSGRDLHRPGFQRMMEGARARAFRAVVVYRLDRISRNISDFSSLIQELGRLGVDFVSIRESFDTSSPMGRAMMYIASVFSQLERETIAERIRDNMHELARTGRWLGGVTPTGYASESVKTVTVDGRSKRSCKLRLIPEEAEVVRKIYDLYRHTRSLSMTEAQLLHDGIKTKNGRDFTRFSIKAILQNPVYLMADREAYAYFEAHGADLCAGPEAFDGTRGVLAYHRTDQEKGRPTVYLPVSAWIVAVGQHPGLVPGRIWAQVQQALARSGPGTYRPSRGNEALLTGLLRCACGSRMYPKRSQRQGADGRPIYTYVCKGKERSKGVLCSCRNVRGDILDAAVVEALRELPEEPGCLLSRLEQGGRRCLARHDQGGHGLEALQRQQARTQRSIAALVNALAGLEDRSAAVHLTRRLEELHAQAADLQARIAQLEGPDRLQALSNPEMEGMGRALAAWGESLEQMNLEQTRAAIGAAVREVTWDGTRALVWLWDAPRPEPDTQAAVERLPYGEDSK